MNKKIEKAENKETNKGYFIGNYTDIAIQGKAIVTVT